ncbi:MAG: hypothetical protein EZS28_030100 [Streblomastix strix]|uniref:Uncharacterized protein n=1 Tax=Streblomastix strix TaxID=222440 RepID=A0A5J4UVQ2_9EUKA|nr:MAG: hypothetical protein EZS28_030100 [Streblomastix strix]
MEIQTGYQMEIQTGYQMEKSKVSTKAINSAMKEEMDILMQMDNTMKEVIIVTKVITIAITTIAQSVQMITEQVNVVTILYVMYKVYHSVVKEVILDKKMMGWMMD